MCLNPVYVSMIWTLWRLFWRIRLSLFGKKKVDVFYSPKHPSYVIMGVMCRKTIKKNQFAVGLCKWRNKIYLNHKDCNWNCIHFFWVSPIANHFLKPLHFIVVWKYFAEIVELCPLMLYECEILQTVRVIRVWDFENSQSYTSVRFYKQSELYECEILQTVRVCY